MKHDQYLEDLHDGVDMAHKNRGPTSITVTEATRLHKSINATTDPERMKDDTIFRTNGACGANDAQRINGIADSFEALNCGRDGG
jgi:hypothetical protein